MNSGPSVLRPSKANTELTTSLRANFTSHRLAQTSPDSNQPPSFRSWTTQDSSTLYIPTQDFTVGGLAEERKAYDITLKLFFLPGVPPTLRCTHTKEALDLVLRTLGVPSVDLLIVAFPGIHFDADDESDSDGTPSPHVSPTSSAADPSLAPAAAPVEPIESMARTWRTLEALHAAGQVDRLGLSEFGSARLARFLPATTVRPAVDQINVRDCCVVPKPLIMFAKREGIELLTHNDWADVLPRGTLRELLGGGEGGMGVLAGPEEQGEGLKGDIEPLWVIKYTAVVKDRGVVENKGYFAGAELNER